MQPCLFLKFFRQVCNFAHYCLAGSDKHPIRELCARALISNGVDESKDAMGARHTVDFS